MKYCRIGESAEASSEIAVQPGTKQIVTLRLLVDASYQLAHNYAYYALNGNCTGCTSGGVKAQTPSDSCKGRNPVNGNGSLFGTTCPAATCTGNNCVSLSSIQSTAVKSGWNPEDTAQTVLVLMKGVGEDIYTMDEYMAVAAMEQQGCYNCPNACTQLDDYCGCTPSSKLSPGEGFGVLQESLNSSGSLMHASTALDQVTSHGHSIDVWFPSGITPCTVLKDPGTAFKEFYWAALSTSLNNCQTIGWWMGKGSAAADCGEAQYTDQTGNAC